MAKKQDNNAIPLIAGALGFGVLAALLAMFYLNSKEAELKAKYEENQAQTLRVVVANQDLRKGQEITKNLFSARAVPGDFVHDDAIYPGEFDRYIGRSLIANLGRGKTLLKSFMDEDFPRDFSDVIPAGKRAMTITVDDINSIGGFLRPGNRIDIFVNIPFSASGFSPELFEAAKEAGMLALLPTDILTSIPGELLAAADGAENPTELLGMLAPDDVIIPVTQNVTVLAAGRDPYRETLDALRQPQRRTETTFSHITLEVDPQQAALITLAEDKGDIVALLRNRNDQSASAFTTVGSPDLFSNAAKMASAEKERASRATVAGGVDLNGNLVDADGNKIMSAEQLAAAGFSVNENGQIVDKNGNVVDPKDLVVAADGTVMTKQQLAAAGLSVNAAGQIIDKDGNVVDVNDVVVAADGTVMTKQQLAAAGLSVNANGEIVDSSGKIVSADDMIVAADGSVITKDQLAAAGIKEAAGTDPSGNLVDADGNVLMSKAQLEAAGYTVNADGQIVDKDGNIVDPKNILVDKDGNIVDPNSLATSADGSILSKEQLAAAGITAAAGTDSSGNLVDADGNVLMSKAQLEAAGYTVNADGQIVDKDGNIVDPKNILVDKDGNIVDPSSLVTSADGSVLSKEQLAAAGLSVDENGNIVDRNGNIVDKDDLVTGPDGTILSKKALAEKGLSVNAKGEIVDANGVVLSDAEVAAVAEDMVILGSGGAGRFNLIIGGASEDGVAKSLDVDIQSDSPAPVAE
ncbi:MAG: Flp pilus assembly protein CpaB [Gammaproteobacteria bacterium]|nr:Flp pilus assembly protein CpaB [Gammaproteobacteria bacterium]